MYGRTDKRTKSGKPHVGRPLLGPAVTWEEDIQVTAVQLVFNPFSQLVPQLELYSQLQLQLQLQLDTQPSSRLFKCL